MCKKKKPNEKYFLHCHLPYDQAWLVSTPPKPAVPQLELQGHEPSADHGTPGKRKNKNFSVLSSLLTDLDIGIT